MVVPSAVNNGSDAGEGLLEVDWAAGVGGDKWRILTGLELYPYHKVSILPQPADIEEDQAFTVFMNSR